MSRGRVRAAISLFALLLAVPAAGSDASLPDDDECRAGPGASDGGCALNALQRRGAKVQSEEPAETVSAMPQSLRAAASSAAAGAQPRRRPVPRRSPNRRRPRIDPGPGVPPRTLPPSRVVNVNFLNNASNAVVLANCHSKNIVAPGQSLDTFVAVGSGLWVLAEGEELQCEQGCSDCFYVKTFASKSGAAKAAIGYGLDRSPLTPVGGGIELSAAGGSRQCTDDLCLKSWRKPIKISGGAALKVVVHGSMDGLEQEEEPEAEEAAVADSNSTETEHGTLTAKHRGHGGGRRSRKHTRTWWRRRPVRRARPIYRPGRPVYRRSVSDSCRFCHEHGPDSCWWLCSSR